MARILIVDDRPANRDVLVTLLGYQGHQMLEADDGADALAAVRTEHPDLVITDILMPTMDGYEFARQLRADPAIAATPVVFYTAHYHRQEAAQLVKNCGVGHVLIKPCEPELILQTVQEALSAPLQITSAWPPANFDKQHLRVVTDKLAKTADQLTATNQRLAALIDISLQLASERDPQRMLENVCRAAREVICSKYAAIGVTSKENTDVVYFTTSGIEAGVATKLRMPRLDTGIFSDVLTKRRARRVVRATGEPALAGLPQDYPPVHSALIAPVASLSHVYGWICLTDKLGAEAFDQEDEELLGILSAQTGRIYENGSLYARVQEHAARLLKEVAERKRTQETLAESEQRFRQIAENISEVFWLIDPAKNQILYVSPAYEKIWGRSCESLYASPNDWLENIHSDDRERVQRAAQKQASGDYAEEYRIVRSDGSTRWIRDRAFPVVRNGNDVYRVTGIAEDITERKRAAEELRESERRFSSMLGNVELVSVMLDGKARITYCNDHFIRLTGWQRQEVIGQSFLDVFIPPELIDELHGVYKTLLADRPEAWHYENEILTRSGGRRLIRWNNSVLRSAAGEPIGTASIGEDITEQKLADEKIRRLNRVYAVLSGINTLIVRVKDRHQLFDEACRIAVEHGNFGIAWIGLLDPDTLDVTPVAYAGLNANERLANAESSAAIEHPEGQGIVGRAIRERQIVFSNSPPTEPGTGERRQEAVRLGYCSRIALPLLVNENICGILVLYAKEKDFFNEEELRLLEELAGDISFALTHIDQEAKLAKLSRIRAVSSGINTAIVRISDRPALLKEACRIATDVGKFELVWIASLMVDKQQILPVAWSGFSDETAHAVTWAGVSSAAGTLREAIESRQPAVRNNLEAEVMTGALRNEALKKGCLSTICLPLMAEGAVVAAISLFAPGRNFFDADECSLLNEVAADISFALDHIAKAEKLNYLAYYDDLTGLPNRTLLQDYLGRVMRRAKEEGSKAALIMVDIKRFSHVNETLGRQSGDALLREFAQRLKQLWPEPGNVGRISADYFAGIVANFREAAEIAHLIVNSLAKALSREFKIAGENLRISATAGIAIFPGDGDDMETMFKNAEAALKQAKTGGEKYLFYHAKMNAAVTETLRLENNLRRAIDNNEFVLHYQPKVELATGKIRGLEALIRWNDPASGLVSPTKFIPLLEETGMILEVGIWAIRQALHDYHEWYVQGLQPPRVAVNVSLVQLRQKNFVELVGMVIKESKSTPHGLDLEITESLIMDDIEGNIAKLKSLRDMGINIAIDDFGTGYSSLGYLAQLPVNLLKIDRTFIVTMTKTPDSLTIVSTIISLAHSLNMKVIAESVETEEQSRFLKLLKCDEMQGYLFSKPLPAEQLIKLFEERRDN